MNHFLSSHLPAVTRLIPALLLAASMAIHAQQPLAQSFTTPNWDNAAALSAATHPDNAIVVGDWLQQIEAGNSTQLLAALQLSAHAASPAFEAQLHQLAIALAEAPLAEIPFDSPADDVLAWLANYPSQVLVAHEEFATYGVPLFAVAAAAQGSQLQRQRRLAAQNSGPMLTADPERWTQRYLAASVVERQGYIQNLQAAPPERLFDLATQLQLQLPIHAEFAAPAGVVASRLSDPQLFLTAYRYSSGTDSVAILREAGWRLDAAQRSELFTGLMALPAADKAGLGISLLAPSLQSNPQFSATLLQLLDNPELGAASALALAGHPDPAVQASLQSMLKAGGLKGRRAALALDKNALSPSAGLEP
jgi:hypothetical protein